MRVFYIKKTCLGSRLELANLFCKFFNGEFFKFYNLKKWLNFLRFKGYKSVFQFKYFIFIFFIVILCYN